jgi:hypothetical protein
MSINPVFQSKNPSVSHEPPMRDNIIRVTEPRRINQEGHVARMEDIRHAYKILIEKSGGKTTRQP